MMKLMSKRDWLVLVPVAAILALVLVLTAVGAPANARTAPAHPAATVGQQDQSPVCKTCHAVETHGLGSQYACEGRAPPASRATASTSRAIPRARR